MSPCWRRQEVEPYRPVVVVGIDEEKNLFRLGAFSQALREYSWKPGPQPPLMARPLGAFIYFLKEPPRALWPHPAQYALTEESFRLVEQDPLAPIRALPGPVYEALTFQNGCVYCHSFRGAGTKSHHILAATGAPHGGFALPLEDYPPDVWKEFIFNQIEVAKKMGVSPTLSSRRRANCCTGWSWKPVRGRTKQGDLRARAAGSLKIREQVLAWPRPAAIVWGRVFFGRRLEIVPRPAS
ncbi:MAG TPA: hypothetical protein VNL14_11170 [Candidatus Acidoferrales bacterium]|nr:hypothetical protein [Candidatus Acidoferrales bacterium]